MRLSALSVPSVLSAVLLGLCAAAAQATSFDARGVARFDIGYARCEAKYPHMRGYRDEAYLAAYRVKADASARNRLAALRRGAEYQKERRSALRASPKAAPAAAASSPLEHQCQALWAAKTRAGTPAR